MMQEKQTKENSDLVSEDTINYVTLLLGMEVMLNASYALEGTKFFKAKVQSTVNNAIKTLNKYNSTNQESLWNADEEQVSKMMWAIHLIAEQIAKGDGIALSFITNLTRQGFDFSRCVIKELTDEELLKLKEDGYEGE